MKNKFIFRYFEEQNGKNIAELVKASEKVSDRKNVKREIETKKYSFGFRKKNIKIILNLLNTNTCYLSKIKDITNSKAIYKNRFF